MPGATEIGPSCQNNPYDTKEGSSMEGQYMKLKKQTEAKKEAEKGKTLRETVKDQEGFKRDMAKFYGVNPGLTKNVDLNHFISQKGKENEQL